MLHFDLKKHPSPRHQAEAAFDTARRLRRGSSVIEGLLVDASATAAALVDLRARLDVAASDLADPGAAASAEAAVAALAEHMAVPKVAGRLDIKLAPGAGSSGGGSSSGSDGGSRGGGSSGRSAAKKNARAAGGKLWSGRTFVSPGGVPILVGRNRRENDYLS